MTPGAKGQATGAANDGEVPPEEPVITDPDGVRAVSVTKDISDFSNVLTALQSYCGKWENGDGETPTIEYNLVERTKEAQRLYHQLSGELDHRKTDRYDRVMARVRKCLDSPRPKDLKALEN